MSPPSSIRSYPDLFFVEVGPKPGDSRTADSPVTIPSRKSFCPQPYPVTAPTPQMDTPVFVTSACHPGSPSTLQLGRTFVRAIDSTLCFC